MSLVVAPPDPPQWLKQWMPQFKPTDRVEFKDEKTGDTFWKSNEGAQTWGLLCPFSEILCGGARGGSKSELIMAWMAMGDPSLAPNDPARESFLNDPSFRGLLLRKHYDDMAEFIDRCAVFYKRFGGKAKDNPVVFEFKSGAKIYTNHLRDEDAFNKYRGWGITKVGIEEGTQIEKQKSYMALFGSRRSVERVRHGKVYPKLRTQLMMSVNPDGPGACVPYGDVLTGDGWRDIRDMRVGDKAWSIHPETGEMMLKEVDQVHAVEFTGELYQAEGRGIHVSCTPDHKILRFNTTKADRSLVLQSIDDFPGQVNIVRSALKWRGSPHTEVVPEKCDVRRRILKQPSSLCIEDYAALVGWMVTEGCLVRRDNALCISQKKPDGRKKLKSFLDRCGFSQRWGATGVLISSHEWTQEFSWLQHATTKSIPQWVKNLSSAALHLMIEAMVDGDGHWDTANSGTFYSSSASLATDFTEIALKCGYLVYSNGRQRNKHGGTIKGRKISSSNYAYEVAFHRQDLPGSEIRTGNHKYRVGTSTKRLNASRTTYSGTVYCIGVRDTHTFIIRQKGCVWVSGNCWIKPRFIEVKSGSKLIPWNTPMKDPITKLQRIFIPMNLKDNPYLRDDMNYLGMLLSQDSVKQKQWIEGDWNAGIGAFFESYRPQGPMGAKEALETPWARHLIKGADLKPWWYRWGSGDWGYDHPAAFHKYCRNESDKRIHVYDELVVRKLDSYELGVKLAGWWLRDLEGIPDHQITLFLDPSAFSKTDASKTKAEQIGLGIKEILGPFGSLLLRYNEEERDAAARDPKVAAMLFERRKAEVHGQMCIILKPANNTMADGCDYMRQLLRFNKTRSATEEEIKTHLEAVYSRSGLEAYEQTLTQHRDQSPEILPRVQIWDVCKGLDQFIRAAQRNEPPKNEEYLKWDYDSETGTDGDDCGDSWRYGCMGYKDIETLIPRSYWVNDRISQFQRDNQEQFGVEITDPTRLAMMAQKQNYIYSKANENVSGGSFTFARQGSTMHRKVQ